MILWNEKLSFGKKNKEQIKQWSTEWQTQKQELETHKQYRSRKIEPILQLGMEKQQKEIANPIQIWSFKITNET